MTIGKIVIINSNKVLLTIFLLLKKFVHVASTDIIDLTSFFFNFKSFFFRVPY